MIACADGNTGHYTDVDDLSLSTKNILLGTAREFQ